MKKRFEIGKAYQHNSGMQLFICGMADTVYHGLCFIAEQGWNRKRVQEWIGQIDDMSEENPVMSLEKKGLVTVSMKEYAFVNWTEITKEEFISETRKSN